MEDERVSRGALFNDVSMTRALSIALKSRCFQDREFSYIYMCMYVYIFAVALKIQNPSLSLVKCFNVSPKKSFE